MKRLSILFPAFLFLVACLGSKTSVPVIGDQNQSKQFVRSPKAIVYRTVRDYHKNVPVLMDEQKKNIISYPAPMDVFYKDVLAFPTPLRNGFWLDNRGVNQNVVFTSFTYEEYSKLSSAPDLETLKSKIIDYYPLLEMYECGFRADYKDEVKELNAIIEAGFPGCKRLFGFGTIRLEQDF